MKDLSLLPTPGRVFVLFLAWLLGIFIVPHREALANPTQEFILPHTTGPVSVCRQILLEKTFPHISQPEVRKRINHILDQVGSRVVGQEELIKKIMVAILADGHVLIEGPPGVAKTRVVKTYAEALGASWNRIQFVPDMMPRDITGTLEFDSQRSERKLIGSQLPYNLIIGDEINRATPKLQAALLETMEERQFTVFGQTIKMPEFFIFLATQNPFENRGTFDLPEAQLDRFLFKLRVNFPSQENEREILKISKNEKLARLAPNQSPVSNLITESDQETILAAQSLVLQMEAPKKIEDYILLIAAVTRQPELYDGNLPLEIKMGIGPRASQSLYLASMAMAWLNSHSEVEISDVDAIAADVMRHRIVLSDEALIENTSVESIINNILSLAKKNLDGSK